MRLLFYLNRTVQRVLAWSSIVFVGWLAVSRFSTNLAVIDSIRSTHFLQACGVFALVAAVFLVLRRIHPVFGWRLVHVFKSDGRSGPPTNANTLGLSMPFVWVVYGVCLIVSLPFFARVEEEVFRSDTQNWADALWRSVLFGLVHMLIGIPLGAALALTVLGLWLTQVYFDGGIELSTQAHTAYNLIIFGGSFAFLVLLRFVRWWRAY